MGQANTRTQSGYDEWRKLKVVTLVNDDDPKQPRVLL
jgi:hypothetical protein